VAKASSLPPINFALIQLRRTKSTGCTHLKVGPKLLHQSHISG
jgi:hypothetical protein